MSENTVAKAEINDRKQYRQYKKSENNSWESGTVRADYDVNPDNMTNEQIILQHKELLKMQKEENYLNNSHTATDIAKRRNELWKTAEKRGIEKELL